MEPMDNAQVAHLRQWIGRTEETEDVVSPGPLRAMRALLDRDAALPAEGTPLPPLWHWLYCLPSYGTAEAGPDGHAARGGFLPPVPLPKRMWAGGRLTFPGVLRVGERITRLSTIQDVRVKEGRSGPLAFVVVRHEMIGPRGVAVTEEHDIVYRDDRGGSSRPPPPMPDGAAWSETVTPGPLLLFRYSALTYNGHRIHYDRAYCREVEGYPGLVVHGPLTATLLADLALRHGGGRSLAAFDFRAVAPLFDHQAFTLQGRPDGGAAELWAGRGDGLAMTARAVFATEDR